MVIIINTQRSGSYLDESFCIFGSPALLHFPVFAELGLYQVVFRVNTDGREGERAKFQDGRSVYVTLRFLQHGFDVAHNRFEVLAFVEEHPVPVGNLVFPVLLPFAQRIFFEETVCADDQHGSGSFKSDTSLDTDDGVSHVHVAADTVAPISSTFWMAAILSSKTSPFTA